MLKQMFNMIIRNGGGAQSSPSLDSLLAGMDKHLENFDTLIQPALESKPRTPFDAHLPKSEMTMANLKPRQKLRVIPKALPLIINMQRAARMYDGKFRPTRSEAPPQFLRELEALARKSGAKDIRYVRVPPNAIFKGKGLPDQYAIVYTV
ncbi:MAG: hypothetical protein IAE80_18250, partial [Anaerolinea sp.]|nr:hypothetical protein [Anaerolinea sp.]